MARKSLHDRDMAARRRAGFSPVANVRGAMARAVRRELKKRLFAGRERVPCCFCARELTRQEATLEHIRPRSRGGPTAIENLTISCPPCNSRRGDMGYEKFRGMVAQGRGEEHGEPHESSSFQGSVEGRPQKPSPLQGRGQGEG